MVVYKFFMVFKDFVIQHLGFYAFMIFAIAMVAYFGGEAVRKYCQNAIIQGKPMSFPYKQVSLVLNILGIVMAIFAAVVMYFAGGYDRFLSYFH